MNTRNHLVPAALILSTLLPSAAFAEGRSHRHRGDDAPRSDHRWAPDDGFITVRNENLAPLQVLVDGKVQGDVDARSAARFGPFDLGRHKVRVRFVGDGLRFPVTVEKVFLDGRSPARIIAPELDAGLLVVRNEWVEPMTVVLNGRTVGQVAPNARDVLRVDRARGRIELRTPGGTTAVTKQISMHGLEQDRMALQPPREGIVSVFNPSATHPLEIVCARGNVLARIAPRTQATILQPAGHVTLTATYRRTPIQSATVLASPYDASSWTVALPTRASLAVRNPNRFPVDVYVAGARVATVPGNEALVLEGMPTGLIEVEVRGEGRRGFIATVLTTQVDPLSGGFLPVPEARIADGRGAYGSYGGSTTTSSCDTPQTPTRGYSRGRGGRSGSTYASYRR